MDSAKFLLLSLTISMLSHSIVAVCTFEPDGTFLPDPDSRERFIWCSGGQGTIGFCPPGMEFNPFERFCDDPAWIPTTTNRPPTRDPCWNQPDGTFMPDPSSRNRFFWCSGGQGTVGTCPDDLVFDPVSRFCDYEHKIPTTTNRPPTRDACWNQPDGIFLPDPSNRNRFIFCNGGQGTIGNCPDNMIFHYPEGFCDYEDETTTTRRATPPVRPPPTTRPPVPTPRPTPPNNNPTPRPTPPNNNPTPRPTPPNNNPTPRPTPRPPATTRATAPTRQTTRVAPTRQPPAGGPPVPTARPGPTRVPFNPTAAATRRPIPERTG